MLAKEYGVDNVRFYITSILPEHKDANFKWSDFRQVINDELVDKIGNLIHRVLVFYKDKLGQETNNKVDPEVIKKIEETFHLYKTYLEKVENSFCSEKFVLKFS